MPSYKLNSRAAMPKLWIQKAHSRAMYDKTPAAPYWLPLPSTLSGVGLRHANSQKAALRSWCQTTARRSGHLSRGAGSRPGYLRYKAGRDR